MLTRDITNGMTFAPKACYQHFVVLLNEVETTIIGDEGSDLLAVLDQLHTNALSDGRVRLLGFNTTEINNEPRSTGAYSI